MKKFARILRHTIGVVQLVTALTASLTTLALAAMHLKSVLWP